MSVKISIESNNDSISAAIAAIIDDALAKHGFTNVKGKMVMVVQEPVPELAYFKKVSQVIPPEITRGIELRPKAYSTELIEARIAYGYPVMFDWMREVHPQVQSQPVLIDTGIEPTPYAKEVRAFLEGKS